MLPFSTQLHFVSGEFTIRFQHSVPPQEAKSRWHLWHNHFCRAVYTVLRFRISYAFPIVNSMHTFTDSQRIWVALKHMLLLVTRLPMMLQTQSRWDRVPNVKFMQAWHWEPHSLLLFFFSLVFLPPITVREGKEQGKEMTRHRLVKWWLAKPSPVTVQEHQQCLDTCLFCLYHCFVTKPQVSRLHPRTFVVSSAKLNINAYINVNIKC